jgi:hypothetical protein
MPITKPSRRQLSACGSLENSRPAAASAPTRNWKLDAKGKCTLRLPPISPYGESLDADGVKSEYEGGVLAGA